jgi:hypothetical protein
MQKDEKGEQSLIVNEEANGNAWFVQALSTFDSQDYIMTRLGATSTRHEAIAVKGEIDSNIPSVFSRTEQAVIQLDSYAPDHLSYSSSNPDDGFAVFSELYYKNGWNAYLDGQLVPHYRVDYALRGLFVPKGTHSIEFKFEPQVVKTGSLIQLLSFVLLIFLIGYTAYRQLKNE